MKLTATFYLLAASLLLFNSCKKEDFPGPCNNCIVVEPDPLSLDTTSTEPPAINIRGSEALISLNSEGDFTSSQFEISIMGENGYILYPETFGFSGPTLAKNWSYYDLKPGTYTVQIKQLNYVAGSDLPTFDIAVASPDGVNFGSVATMSQINPDSTEVSHSLILRVIP